MPTIKIEDDQCLIDIAMQEVGTIEAVITLAVLNNISITDDIKAGDTIMLVPIVASRIISIFKDNNLYPASNTVSNEEDPEGIGYMALGLNFNVL